MNAVEIESKVKLNLTARQWQLYSDMPGVDAVAEDMNARIADALNAGDTSAAFAVLREYSKYGAADSEPYWVLESIMRAAAIGGTSFD